jgi:hypothetical protein
VHQHVVVLAGVEIAADRAFLVHDGFSELVKVSESAPRPHSTSCSSG